MSRHETHLLEQLLHDPVFREQFRRDPAAAARAAGLDALAEELALGDADPMQTLEPRESRSSLAGVLMAAALEGIGIYEGGKHLLPHVDAAQAAAIPASPRGAAAGASDLASRSPPQSNPVGQAGAEQQQIQGDVAQAMAAQQQSPNPDDLTGNLDDEDAGGDESDGSDENEPDENEPDEAGGDSGGDGGGNSDGDQDAPGEGSNGEDANDTSADSHDPSQDHTSDGSDGGQSTDGSDGGAGGTPDLQGVDSAYPGDGAPREQVAAWMASSAQKRGLPPELPVMAALTESGLKNLSGGDADSVGFFQMRVSVWNQGAYSGYPDKPDRQLQWFLDHAEAVKKQRLARGLSVDDPNQYGDWVADVENPAAQFRGRYQQHLADARQLLAHAATKPSGGDGVAQVADVASGAHAGPRALAAVADARKFLGTPYRWGGSSPKTGFDCSGLVQWVYAQAGIRIPRVTDQQILAPGGVPVGRRQLLPGDLVFFRDSSGYVHHVGISLGGDRFLHSPHTGDVVKISSLNESYYAQQFTGGRRFDSAAPGGRAAAVVSEQRSQGEAARIAQAALERDAAQVRQPDSELFRMLQRQERAKGELRNAVEFLRAVDPSQAGG
jgi:cell wall-associated NlpC family hydrolase